MMNSSSITIIIIIGLITIGAIIGPILAHRRHAVELQAQLIAQHDSIMQTMVNEKKAQTESGGLQRHG
jgi:hypothetical protein